MRKLRTLTLPYPIGREDMLWFRDTPDLEVAGDLTGTVKAERVSFQWRATSANTTDSARQDHKKW
jgi:hypothetical protein